MEGEETRQGKEALSTSTATSTSSVARYGCPVLYATRSRLRRALVSSRPSSSSAFLPSSPGHLFRARPAMDLEHDNGGVLRYCALRPTNLYAPNGCGFPPPRHAGAGVGSSVEFLGRGMVGMQLRDAKLDVDDEMVLKGS